MYVYILASRYKGTLYIGVTNDLIRRVYEHRVGVVPGFTRDHNVKTLVYYEQLDAPEQAITREKQLKNWNRDWKINLINGFNPDWKDLYDSITA